MWKRTLLAGLLAVVAATLAAGESYDVVLAGGRVMDPASNLDATRDVGLRGGRIAAVSATPLSGRVRVDVRGLVVAPGFIDLHQHGFQPGDLEFKVRDGVTTACELEIGAFPVNAWYQQLTDRSPVNYGVAVSHPGVRLKTFRPLLNAPLDLRVVSYTAALGKAGERELAEMERLLRAGLDEGALGIGFGIVYTPAADRVEVERMFRVAAGGGVPAFVHVRGNGVGAIEECLGLAERAACALHVVHIGSSASRATAEALAAVDARRARGLDVTTEVYPYTAGSTRLDSGVYDPGWQERLGISYGDLLWPATGERLTAESFARYRQTGGWVVSFTMKENDVSRALVHPGVMIASDGIPFENGAGHPRGAGTFARVLGHYSRERGELPLMEALRKMTLLPAERLAHVAAMRRKGRIAEGMDADITIFDPATVLDRATYTQLAPSAGIVHVLVNGTFVLRDGERVTGAMPGQPIRRR